MKQAIICFSLLLGVSGLPQVRNTPEERLAGGQYAEIADYPYTLSLQHDSSHICGAVMISPAWAITVAHCVDDQSIVENLVIRAGSSMKSSGGQEVSVVKIVQHPYYDDLVLDYDIAVIKVSPEISIDGASPAVLPDVGATFSEEGTATVTGWGYLTQNGSSQTEQLVVDEIHVINKEDCRNLYYEPTITENMFCVGETEFEGKGVCKGDDGGPAVVDGILAGVSSWGLFCGDPLYPGVFSSVYVFRSWIQENTGI